jgi:hypothetical protein
MAKNAKVINLKGSTTWFYYTSVRNVSFAGSDLM